MKLDRLGRSAVDRRSIADELEDQGTRLNIGGSMHDPSDPTGKRFSGMLSLMVEFESDLLRARTEEGMAEAKKPGRLKGEELKLSCLPRKRLPADYETGENSAGQLCEISGLSRSSMYATLRGRETQVQSAGCVRFWWTRAVVALVDVPLNDRQLDVLAWVGEGCPARDWPNPTYKTVAIALQNRRLLTVSKKGGQWRADLLDAGRHYLAHGTYPPGHLQPKKRSRTTPAPTTRSETARSRPSDQTSPTPNPETPSPSSVTVPQPPKVTPSRQLLRDVIDAGGRLTRTLVAKEVKKYPGLVLAINRGQMAPDGQRLVMEHGSNYYERIFFLEDLPVWTTTPPREVVDAPRIGRWHPVVVEIRDDARARRFGIEVRTRALRILHAIATEAETRGHQVSAPPAKTTRGSGRYAHKETGQLVITIRSYRFFVDLTQRDDYTPHTPTPEELEAQRRYEWRRPPRWDTSPGRRLQLTVYGEIFQGWEKKWSDSKTLRARIEDNLAEALRIIETATDREDDRKAAEQRAFEEQHRRREAAEQLVGARHAENVRAEVLDRQLEDWQHTIELRRYIAAMAKYVDTLTDEQARAAATEWLHWCQRHVDDRNPLTGTLAMPPIRHPTWEERSTLLNEIMADLATGSD